MLFVARILITASLAAQPSVGTPSSHDGVDHLVPNNSWGYMIVRDVQQLNGYISDVLRRAQLPPIDPLNLIDAKLNLGPQLFKGGPFGIIFLPFDEWQDAGARSVLAIRCHDVKTWLSAFKHAHVKGQLWHADLVWGKTWVIEQPGFAVLASSEETANRFLSSGRGHKKHSYAQHQDADVLVWVDLGLLRQQPTFLSWLDGLNTDHEQSPLGQHSLLSSWVQWLHQIDEVHIGVELASTGMRVDTRITPEPASALSQLLTNTTGSERDMHSALVDQPYLLTLTGELSTSQANALTIEWDKLLTSESITNGTQPEQLAEFKSHVHGLFQQTKSFAMGVASLNDGPQGLLGLSGVVQVDDANGWIAKLRTASNILGETLFIHEDSNPYFDEIVWRDAPYPETGRAIHELLVSCRRTSSPVETVDYAAAVPSRFVFLFEILNEQAILFSTDASIAALDALSESLRSPELDMTKGSAMRKIRPALSVNSNLSLTWSFEEMIRIGRVLARKQDRVEQFGLRLPPVQAPMACTLRSQGNELRLTITLPADLIMGLVAAYSGSQPTDGGFEPRPSQN